MLLADGGKGNGALGGCLSWPGLLVWVDPSKGAHCALWGESN